MYLSMRAAILLAILGIFSFGVVSVYGESLYTYTDGNGVRVFTNIPPKGPVREMKTINGPEDSSQISQGAIPNRKTDYDPIIDKYATQYNLDPSLIRSMIATESAFNAKAVSKKGAQGLMQLMPATASRLGVRNAFDPEQNIEGGVKHMRYLLDTFDNDLTLSLAAYNAGENLVQRLGKVPNIPETSSYVQTITKRYGRKTLAASTESANNAPSTYRYVDESGILHLTSVPPAQKSGTGMTGWALQSQLLQ